MERTPKIPMAQGHPSSRTHGNISLDVVYRFLRHFDEYQDDAVHIEWGQQERTRAAASQMDMIKIENAPILSNTIKIGNLPILSKL